MYIYVPCAYGFHISISMICNTYLRICERLWSVVKHNSFLSHTFLYHLQLWKTHFLCVLFNFVHFRFSSVCLERKFNFFFVTFIGPRIVIYFCSKTNQTHVWNLFYFGTTLYMFRTVAPSIIRSLRLYIQHQVYVIQVLWLLASKQQQNLYGMMLYVQS